MDCASKIPRWDAFWFTQPVRLATPARCAPWPTSLPASNYGISPRLADAMRTMIAPGTMVLSLQNWAKIEISDLE